MAELKETDLDRNPYVQFERWFADAREAQTPLPEGMTVATCDKNGVVSARVCLLKSFDQHGFVFFTNFSSRKGEQDKAQSGPAPGSGRHAQAGGGHRFGGVHAPRIQDSVNQSFPSRK